MSITDQYDFTWSNLDTPGFTVLPKTKDTSTTSLTITGRGSQNWGQDLQENLLWLLESFASPTQPDHARTGQLWYDTTNKTLKVFDSTAAVGSQWATASGAATASTTAPANPQAGSQWFNPNGISVGKGTLSIHDGTKWIQVYPLTVDSISKAAFVTEYNSMVTAINKLLGSPQGSTLLAAFGWNQTSSLISLETSSTLTNAKWLSLLASLTSICDFLGIDTSGIATYGFMYESGNVIPIGMATMVAQYTSTLNTLTSLSAGTVRFKPTAAALESSTPGTGTVSRSTTWSGTLTRDLVATFASANVMNAYFNAGGQVQFTSTLTGALTGRDFDFETFLSTLGTIKFSATGSIDTPGNTNSIGFYDLTSAYKLIFSVIIGDNTFKVNAKLDSAAVIRFQIQYVNPGTLYGGVGGTLKSTSIYVRPSATYLGSPVLAFPTVASTPLV